MSTTYEMQGTIHSIGETKEYGSNGFTKREFVILLTGSGENPEYPNYINMEMTKEKCAMLDTFPVGTEVIASVNIGGRLWTGTDGVEKCFNSIQAWKLNPMAVEPAAGAPLVGDARVKQLEAQLAAANAGVNEADVPF